MIYNNQNFYLMKKNIRENFTDWSKYKTKESSDCKSCTTNERCLKMHGKNYCVDDSLLEEGSCDPNKFNTKETAHKQSFCKISRKCLKKKGETGSKCVTWADEGNSCDSSDYTNGSICKDGLNCKDGKCSSEKIYPSQWYQATSCDTKNGDKACSDSNSKCFGLDNKKHYCISNSKLKEIGAQCDPNLHMKNNNKCKKGLTCNRVVRSGNLINICGKPIVNTDSGASSGASSGSVAGACNQEQIDVYRKEGRDSVKCEESKECEECEECEKCEKCKECKECEKCKECETCTITQADVNAARKAGKDSVKCPKVKTKKELDEMVAKATKTSDKDKKKFKTLTIVLGVSAGVLLIVILLLLLSGGKGSSDEMMDF